MQENANLTLKIAKLEAMLQTILEDLIDLKAKTKVEAAQNLKITLRILSEIRALRYESLACLANAYGEEKALEFSEKSYEKGIDYLIEEFEVQGVENE